MTWSQPEVDALVACYTDHKADIYEQCFEDPLLDENKTVCDVVDLKLLLKKKSSEMVQSYQKPFTPKGDVEMSARPLTNQKVKIDLEESFQDLSEKNYFKHLRTQRTNDPYYDVPYLRWILDCMMMQYRDDIAMQMMWNGTFFGAIPNLPNNASDTVDGYGKIINDEIALGTIAPYPTGPLSNTNAYPLVEEFVSAKICSPAKKRKQYGLHLNCITMMKIIRSYRSLYGANAYVTQSPFGAGFRIEGLPNVVFIEEAGLPDDALVLVRENNLHVGTDGPPSLIMEKEKRCTFLLWDFEIGFQFTCPEDICVNDIAII